MQLYLSKYDVSLLCLATARPPQNNRIRMPRKPYIVIDKEYIGLKPFIETLPSHPHGERVLYDKRNFVQLFTVDGIRLVVKQYVRPHRINRFAYAYILKSKAERTMSIGRQLLKLGINTPLPVAFIDTYGKGGLYDIGYSITLFDPDPELRAIVQLDPQEQLAVVEQLAQFTAHMHRSGFFHNDYHEGNIFFGRNEDGTYRFSLIDTNRGRFRRMRRKRCIKDLILFNFDDRLMKRFIYTYAELMGWHPQLTFNAVLHLREWRRFDKSRLRPFLKHLVGIKPKHAKDE